MSPGPGGAWRRLAGRLRRDRGAMCGATLLVLLALAALFAEPLAPYRYDTQHRAWAFHPPMLTEIGLRDAAGGWHRPFVQAISVRDGASKRYVGGEQRYPLRLFVRGDRYRLLGLFPSDIHLFGVDPGGGLFLLGTDQFGRDVLSRVLYGARVSLLVGLLGISLSLGLGLLLGGLAGYRGGWLDFGLMRLVELAMALPGLYLLLVLRDAFGRSLSSLALYLVIVLVLALVDWAPHARVLRGMVLAERGRAYVLAARAQGFGGAAILLRQVLPATFGYVLVAAALSVPCYVLGEVALSFLGLGIQEPEASWGLMLRDAQSVRVLTDFPWLLAPGFFLFLTVLAFNLLGDGLRDALDPRGGGR